jgi:putative nucleotidyltransferase with HDIG domain
MWPFGKTSPRRREIRRSKAERRLAWYRRLPGRVRLVPIALTVGFAAMAAWLVNAGGAVFRIQEGQTVTRAIPSRVKFSLEDATRTIEMRGRARDNSPNYYELDASLLKDIRGRLTNALQLAKLHADDPTALQEEARRARIVLDDDARDELLRIVKLADPADQQRAVDRYQAAVERAIYKLTVQPPLLVEAADQANRRTAANAVLIEAGEDDDAVPTQRTLPVSKLVTTAQPDAVDTVASAAAQSFPAPLQAAMKSSIAGMLRREAGAVAGAHGDAEMTVHPIYRYSADRTNRAAQEAWAAVPKQYEVYAREQLLTDGGVISKKEYELLKAEHQEYRDWLNRQLPPADELAAIRQQDPTGYRQLIEDHQRAAAARASEHLAYCGYALLAILIPLGLTYYLRRPRRRLREDPGRQLTTTLVLLAVLGVSRAVFVATGVPYYAVGVQAFAAGILGIVYARNSGPALAAGLAVLVTLATRQNMGFFLILAVVSATFLFGLHNIRNRGGIVAVGAVATLFALATTLASGLVEGQTLRFAFRAQALPAAATTLAAAFIIEGILPGIERLFKISTNMSLLEWGDASKPLLRVLAAEAPGTYNHSLLVGNLAESAAEAIGAQGLLARIGAYYHDIGKINKPEYFAENQAVGVSRHERLSPAMSHLIIIGHVKDGIEMAREYGLPASLHPFILEHHGTTLVEFFYHAASLQRKPGDPEVSDVQFRYSGPRPQSRETAVVMLCDAVEGAVRAMSDPTPSRIEDTVSKILQRRLMDGQFDECDLTFRELETVQRSVVKSLQSRAVPARKAASDPQLHGGVHCAAPARTPDSSHVNNARNSETRKRVGTFFGSGTGRAVLSSIRRRPPIALFQSLCLGQQLRITLAEWARRPPAPSRHACLDAVLSPEESPNCTGHGDG